MYPPGYPLYPFTTHKGVTMKKGKTIKPRIRREQAHHAPVEQSHDNSSTQFQPGGNAKTINHQ